MIPSPAVMFVEWSDQDESTGETEQYRDLYYVIKPAVFQNPNGGALELVWSDSDGLIRSRVLVAPLQQQGRYWVGTSEDGGIYRLRDVDPYDAVDMSPAGVPQPREVIRAAIASGGMLAQELDAVVAPDNSVVTLMLETSMGTYVRYAGDWQLLSDDSDSLEDMALIPVGSGAVDIWDASEGAQTTVSVFDLPTVDGSGGLVIVQQPGREEEPNEEAAAVMASGVSIPEINQVEDLDLAVRYASAHPGARWYVAKRAKALNAAERIPPEWNGGAQVIQFPMQEAG